MEVNLTNVEFVALVDLFQNKKIFKVKYKLESYFTI
jgi:hypothetical protein